MYISSDFRFTKTNNADPDEMPRSAVTYLGLHCLMTPNLSELDIHVNITLTGPSGPSLTFRLQKSVAGHEGFGGLARANYFIFMEYLRKMR